MPWYKSSIIGQSVAFNGRMKCSPRRTFTFQWPNEISARRLPGKKALFARRRARERGKGGRKKRRKRERENRRGREGEERPSQRSPPTPAAFAEALIGWSFNCLSATDRRSRRTWPEKGGREGRVNVCRPETNFFDDYDHSINR